jgi:hypothetical protein
MIISATAMAANTNKPSLSITPKYIGHQTHESAPVLAEEWLHYDDGTCTNSIGLTNGGTFEGAIRLTPDELGAYNGWYLNTVKFYHGAPGYDQPQHSGTIKIYGQGTDVKPGTLLTSQAFVAPEGEGWVEVPLATQLTVDGTKDLWISVRVTHAAGEYPLGVDSGPAVDGKADWVYAGGSWQELQYIGDPPLDYNWCIYGRVSDVFTDTFPPVTTCSLSGTMQGGVYITDVTATLTATDDYSGVAFTMYKIDSGAFTTYTTPFVVTGSGAHTITFYSQDNAGNKEADKTSTFTIQYPINITITGGFGITASIKNTGLTDMTGVNWKIELTGGLILVGKTKTGTGNIAAGSSITAKDFVIGFGKTTITVTADTATKTATGTVILFFVIGVA